MYEVREVNEIAQLADYRADWTALLSVTPGASFFLSYEWLAVYWRHFAADQRLRVLLCFEGGRLAGVAPLVVRGEATTVGRLRVLTYPLHDWGSYYGPIGPQPAALRRAALQHVLHTRRDWEATELRWLGAPDGESAAATELDFACSGLQHYVTQMASTLVVDFEDDWPHYYESRTAALRKRLRAAERRLHDSVFLRCRPTGAHGGDGDPRWDLYEACEEVARRSWQAGASNGTTLTHPAVRHFFREAHAAAAAAGAAEMNLLFRGGQPIAFAYCYVWRGASYGLRMGFDPAAARDGPGNVLVARMLRDSFERGDRWLDLGVGSPEGKRPWCTRAIPILRVSHFPLGAWRAQLLRTKRAWESRRRKTASPDEATMDPT